MALASKARTKDQYNLEQRLEALIDVHLRDIEENPEMYAAKDRLATIQYVGMFLNRKFGWGEPEAEGVGSSVRKYSGAFRITKPENATGGRTASPRSTTKHLTTVVPADTSDTDSEDAAA